MAISREIPIDFKNTELVILTDFTDDAHPESLSAAQRYLAHCKNAESFTEDCLNQYSDCIPDRGCEGTFINYYAPLRVYINYIRTYFLDQQTLAVQQSDVIALIAPNQII